MHEVITLQLGQRSNYIATHFWNLQESYFTYGENEQSPIDHDVHFRPGIGADGSETFTPRTLIYDLKGGFGTLRKYNALYELTDDNPTALWDGAQVVEKQPEIPRAEYQKSLDEGTTPPPLTSETVRYWSDFNRLFYHPRSIVQLNEYELHSQLMPFDNWSIGEDLFRDLDKEHDLLDRDVRPFAEECDQLRALQIFTGSDDAWGGFAARYVDRLRDEYGKTGLWVWAAQDGTKQQRQKQLLKMSNIARTLYAIAPQVSLYCPLMDPPRSIPSYVSIDLQSEWYTSGIVAAAIETATLPARLRRHYDFEAALAGQSGGTQTIFSLQSSFLNTQKSETLLADFFESDEAVTDFDIDYTFQGTSSDSSSVFTQVQVFRGDAPAGKRDEKPETDAEIERKLRVYASKPEVAKHLVPLRFPFLDSYPRDMLPTFQSESGANILAALTTTLRVRDTLKELQTVATRTVGIDEREALVNGLGELREQYDKGWMSDSDSDDDD
ncbi:hypothetical protein VTN49DRAFT_2868 [Thermomyces lanuginosus]|uniref:uncharacterized protein n=1 Tax=Thermomyces lanuginosus TaxID=5541 RepID=UPI00374204C7